MDAGYIIVLTIFGVFVLCVFISVILPGKKKKAEDKPMNSPTEEVKEPKKRKLFSFRNNNKPPRVHKVDIKKDKQRIDKNSKKDVGEKVVTALYPAESEEKDAKSSEVVILKDDRTQAEKRAEAEQLIKTMGSHATYDSVERMYPQQRQQPMRSYADELMSSLPRPNSMNMQDYSSYNSRMRPSVSVSNDNTTINNGGNIPSVNMTMEELRTMMESTMTREEYAMSLRNHNYDNGQGSAISSDGDPSDEIVKNMIIGEALARPKSKRKHNYYF